MKAPLLAAGVVLLSVAGVVLLTGLPEGSPKEPRKPVRVTATAVEPTTSAIAEPPPFPPLAGNLWELHKVDARLAMPEGWKLTLIGNDERVVRNAGDPLDGNMNLLLLPNIYGFSIEELLTENTDELAINPDLHLEDRREMYVMGRKVLRFDYHGTPRGTSESVRFVAVVWTRGRYQVVLTTTVREAMWPDVAAEIDRSLESLQIRWPIQRTD